MANSTEASSTRPWGPDNPHPVLHLPELADLILLEVDPFELLTSVRSVCRLWRDLVAVSPSIRCHIRKGGKASIPWHGGAGITPLAQQMIEIFRRKASRLVEELGKTPELRSHSGPESGKRQQNCGAELDKQTGTSNGTLSDDNHTFNVGIEDVQHPKTADDPLQGENSKHRVREAGAIPERPTKDCEEIKDSDDLTSIYSYPLYPLSIWNQTPHEIPWELLFSLRRLYRQFEPLCAQIRLFSGLNEKELRGYGCFAPERPCTCPTAPGEQRLHKSETTKKRYRIWYRAVHVDDLKSNDRYWWSMSSSGNTKSNLYQFFRGIFEPETSKRVEASKIDIDFLSTHGIDLTPGTGDVKLPRLHSPLLDVLYDLCFGAYIGYLSGRLQDKVGGGQWAYKGKVSLYWLMGCECCNMYNQWPKWPSVSSWIDYRLRVLNNRKCDGEVRIEVFTELAGCQDCRLEKALRLVLASMKKARD